MENSLTPDSNTYELKAGIVALAYGYLAATVKKTFRKRAGD